MKKMILTFAISVLCLQQSNAGEVYCGANAETVPGSGVYNKSLFWEKVDLTKSIARFLTSDGKVIKSEELTPELVVNMQDGTSAISISFNEGRVFLAVGKVAHKNPNELSFTSTAISGSTLTQDLSMLMADGYSVLCKEMP